jgi:hypothetical protein
MSLYYTTQKDVFSSLLGSCYMRARKIRFFVCFKRDEKRARKIIIYTQQHHSKTKGANVTADDYCCCCHSPRVSVSECEKKE